MSNNAEMFSATFMFTQEGDTCDTSGSQELEVIVQDGGGGKYMVLKTDHWAVDSADDLTALLDRVRSAFGDGWDE